MDAGALVAHSLAEAYLYSMIAPCAACGGGPLEEPQVVPIEPEGAAEDDADSVNDAETQSASADGLTVDHATQKDDTSLPRHIRLTASCRQCKHVQQIVFALPLGLGTHTDGAPAEINVSDERSEIIDLAEWLTLFRSITAAASRETDRGHSRQLGLEAAQCLDEALKFYDEENENDLPPDDAFFSARSRERRRDHPEHFSRRRLLELRAHLPSTKVMRAAMEFADKPKKKRWWRFGR
jgi:hypothetical protein